MTHNIQDFKKQLIRQLNFINHSCLIYDAGHKDEAIRIATSIRVLVHDTKNSTSLLSHLNAKKIRLLSTCHKLPESESNSMLGFFDGFGFKMTSKGLQPLLDDAFSKEFIIVTDWWNQNVAIVNQYKFTRSSIVLAAANKDGGAHVHESIDPEYQVLKNGLWTLSRDGSNIYEIIEHQFHTLRQFGYEILNSPELTDLVK